MRTQQFLALSLVVVIAAGLLSSCASTGKPDVTESEVTLEPAPPPPPPAVRRSSVPLPEPALEYMIMDAPSVVPPPPPGYPRYGNSETYTDIKERPFTKVTTDPLSTFSMHPDSAAYSNIRRFLEGGLWPPFDAVRIEEIINYFSYDYPEPRDEHPFSVDVEVGTCPWAAGHLLAKIGIKGRDLPPSERPPANLVFLIDTSGSMNQPNRLPLVKESLKALLKVLKPGDRVSIVTYAGSSRVALESTPVEEKAKIKDAIETLGAGGSTHGSAGIQNAYAEAEKHFIKKGINRVVLASDGDFNVGVTSFAGLMSLIEEKRKTGVFLTVLGYGMGNLKEANLSMLAAKGNGNYAYINTYSEARRVLVEQATGTLMTIAKDTKAQVEFNPARVSAYRLLGYETKMLAARDFNDDTKDAGEVGVNHTVTALYQIVPKGVALGPGVDALRYQPEHTPPEPAENSDELMFVKLRYKLPDENESRLIEIPVKEEALPIEQASGDLRFAAAAAEFGLLLRNSKHKGTATFDNALELAESAVNEDPKREEFLNLIVAAKTLRKQ